MAKTSKSKSSGRSPLEQLMAKELEKGKKMARDPQNAILRSGALRVTNHNSEWLASECFHCKFKFREEDRVRICPNCEFPLHEDGRFDLKCWSDFFHATKQCPRCNQEISAEPPEKIKIDVKGEEVSETLLAQNIYEQFSAGIKIEWTMIGEGDGGIEPRILHSKNDPLYGTKCMICGEGIRLGDRYVQCPGQWKCCFHADVLRHLTCWTIRFNMKNNDYCFQSGGTCKIELKK